MNVGELRKHEVAPLALVSPVELKVDTDIGSGEAGDWPVERSYGSRPVRHDDKYKTVTSRIDVKPVAAAAMRPNHDLTVRDRHTRAASAIDQDSAVDVKRHCSPVASVVFAAVIRTKGHRID